MKNTYIFTNHYDAARANPISFTVEKTTDLPAWYQAVLLNTRYRAPLEGETVLISYNKSDRHL